MYPICREPYAEVILGKHLAADYAVIIYQRRGVAFMYVQTRLATIPGLEPHAGV